MNRSFQRACARAAVITAGAAALSLAGALAASAHVTVTPDTTAAGSYALLTFGVPHGCEESATTEVAIKIPEQINAVTPTVNPNWDVEKVMVTLDTPITDSHGNEITERVDQVVYTAKTPLPAELRDALVLSVKIPDVVGETLLFPIVQSCEVGETAWIELAAEGATEPEHPAPAFEVTAATDANGHADEAAAIETAAATTATEVTTVPSGAPVSSAEVTSAAAAETTSSNGLAIAGLVAGLLGLIAGGIALLRSRRT